MQIRSVASKLPTDLLFLFLRPHSIQDLGGQKPSTKGIGTVAISARRHPLNNKARLEGYGSWAPDST